MAYITRHTVAITVSAAGDGTGYTSEICNGFVQAIRYVKTDYANGVDFVVTAETSGLTIWSQENVNASATVYPRAATHDTAGVASLYAAGGEPVEDPIPVAQERIKIVVAQGGVSTSGTFHIYVGG